MLHQIRAYLARTMQPAFSPPRAPSAASYSQGKLAAQPQRGTAPQRTPEALGLQPLGLSQNRDGLLYVPQSYADSSKRPAPLIVMMHGASGNAKGGMSYMLELAEEVRACSR